MLQNSITFDELPGAVSSLTALVRELVKEVSELRKMLTPERTIPKSATQFIGIAEACQILGKAKSTVYDLAREGKIPAYKVPGEKEWRFIAGELVDHVKATSVNHRLCHSMKWRRKSGVAHAPSHPIADSL